MKFPSPRSSERTEYAARQADLLDALMRGDDYPTGFDPVKADAAGRALRRKRARAVRHAWPSLTTALGRDFEPRIDAFLTAHPTSGDGRADGLAFVDWIGDPQVGDGEPQSHSHHQVGDGEPQSHSHHQVGDGEPQSHSHHHPVLTGDVQVEIMLSRAAIRRLFVGARRLADPRRLVVVLGAPWIGLRVCCLPLGRY